MADYFNDEGLVLSPLSGDAGFRSYYRFSSHGVCYLAVDAEPKYSNNAGFIAVASALAEQNLNVPTIIHHDLSQGFMCLSDFGDVLFSDDLSLATAEKLYNQAIDILPKIAAAKVSDEYNLPLYDRRFIETELEIFTQWLLGQHLSIELTEDEQCKIEQCFSFLVESALEQPQVFMHRDYHCRNIMVLANKELGIIDFQDAVKGPITYDIVSLLRDCYVRWPDELVENLFDSYCQKVTPLLPDVVTQAQWQRWFDLMGLQRHIKASGIFARLYHRDDKKNYLKDVPLTLDYIVDISQKYPELTYLTALVKEKVKPLFIQSISHKG